MDPEATVVTQPSSTKKEMNTPKIVSLTNRRTDVNINQLFILDRKTSKEECLEIVSLSTVDVYGCEKVSVTQWLRSHSNFDQKIFGGDNNIH